MATFGEELRERRKALGWNAETLAFHAGMTSQQVRNIETGRTRQPRRSTVRLLEKALAAGEGRQAAKAAAQC